jgi:hypothetical protein
VHAALAGVGLCAVRGGGPVDEALLHDCAVHGEAVGGWGLGLGVGGGGGGDEGFQDGVLRWWLVLLGCGMDWMVEWCGVGTHDDGGVPVADFLVLVFGCFIESGVAGLER